MQYLVMEYARCQLQGQLPPEVKTALMPGLYAVLDVMPQDLMRGMNAAMDSSSRAIFKGLYEDYQRFGRWNQS
jgi:nucleolar pre-ribosomal-associated protein 2